MSITKEELAKSFGDNPDLAVANANANAPRLVDTNKELKAIARAIEIMQWPHIGRRAHPEADFREQIRELAGLRGWEFYFTYRSKHSPAGWPDVALCRPPRLILTELKVGKGKLTLAQEKWAALLRACPGVEYYSWRPEDWDNIKEALE